MSRWGPDLEIVGAAWRIFYRNRCDLVMKRPYFLSHFFPVIPTECLALHVFMELRCLL